MKIDAERLLCISIICAVACGMPLFAQESPQTTDAENTNATEVLEPTFVKLRDIAEIEGVRENQLVGFGLVAGLRGQGDSSRSEAVKQMLSNFLQAFDVNLEANDIQSKNSAAVVVTAMVPPFAREGQKIDVTVSSVLDARNIEGGVLMQTTLKGANGEVYAVAQGSVVSAEKDSAHKTVGRILSGAIVERQILSDFFDNSSIAVLLKDPDFTMAVRVKDVIAEKFPGYTVQAVDAERILVSSASPDDFDPVDISARIGELSVQPVYRARIVINRFSGVIVMGQNVRVAPVVISFQESELEMGWRKPDSEQKNSVSIEETATVRDVVDVLTKAGLRVDDIIEVLQTLERAGALYGTLEVM